MPFYEPAMLLEVSGNLYFRYFYGNCFQILRKPSSNVSRETSGAGLSSLGCKEMLFICNLCAQKGNKQTNKKTYDFYRIHFLMLLGSTSAPVPL